MIRSQWMILLACLLTASASAAENAASAPATPDPEAAAPWKRDLERKLDRRVTFEMQLSSVLEASALLRQMSGINLVLDGELENSEKTVTLSVTNSTVKDALNTITSSTQSELLLIDEAVFLFPKGKYALTKPAPPPPLAAESLQEFQNALPDLNSDDFTTREKATARIRALGAAAVPQLKDAYDKELQPEPQQRLRRILDGYSFAGTLNDVTPETERYLRDLKQPLSFDITGMSLDDTLLFLAQMSKLKLTCDPRIGKLPVTLKVNQMSIGSILKWVAILTGTRVTANGEGATFTIKRPESEKEAAREGKK